MLNNWIDYLNYLKEVNIALDKYVHTCQKFTALATTNILYYS